MKRSMAVATCLTLSVTPIIAEEADDSTSLDPSFDPCEEVGLAPEAVPSFAAPAPGVEPLIPSPVPTTDDPTSGHDEFAQALTSGSSA